MVETDSPMTTSVKFSLYQKALVPMDTTESGITILSRLFRENACPSMVVTELPMTTSFRLFS